jgi:putative zinc finger protein
MPTPCPSREHYERLLNGLLDDAEERRLEAHLKACAGCLKTLEELTAVSPRALRDTGLCPLPPLAPGRGDQPSEGAPDADGPATELLGRPAGTPSAGTCWP